MSLIEKLLKASNDKSIKVVSKSQLMDKQTIASTSVPMINVALSGAITGGMSAGATQIVGDSRCFKTNYGLLCMKAFLDAHPEGVALFVDSEFGASREYFETFELDQDRIIHVPILNVEDLKHKLVTYLESIDKGDKVFVLIDSIGLLASKKEVDDAIDDKHVADMTRAKALNSFWRIITPYLTIKDIPMFVINHYYETMAMFSEKVVKGGKQGFLASNDIWFISRSKLKNGTELSGWSFNIRFLKSRLVKENAVIPIEVTYDGGINRWSGLLDIAIILGFVVKPKNGWFTRPDIDDGKNWRRKDTNTEEFWLPILENPDFIDAIENAYSLSTGLMLDDETAEKMENVIEVDDE